MTQISAPHDAMLLQCLFLRAHKNLQSLFKCCAIYLKKPIHCTDISHYSGGASLLKNKIWLSSQQCAHTSAHIAKRVGFRPRNINSMITLKV